MGLYRRRDQRIERARETVYGRRAISKLHENAFRFGVLATGAATLLLLLGALATGRFYIPGLAYARIDRIDQPAAYWFIVLLLLVFVLVPIKMLTSSRYSAKENE